MAMTGHSRSAWSGLGNVLRVAFQEREYAPLTPSLPYARLTPVRTAPPARAAAPARYGRMTACRDGTSPRYRPCRRPAPLLAAAVLACFAGGPPPPAAAFEPADPSSGGCRVRVDTRAQPSPVSLGQGVTVRTRARFDCPDRQRPYHLVVAVDQAAVLGLDAPAPWVHDALASMAARFSLAANPRARVGVVAFDAEARSVCAPTNRTDLLARCLDEAAAPGAAPSGHDGLTAALAAGIRDLVLARAYAPPRQTDDPVREGLVALTVADAAADPASPYCRDAVSAAEAARRKGIEIGLVCLRGDCASTCLRDVAAPGRLADAERWPAFADRQVALVWSTQTRVRKVTVRDVVSPGMAVEPSTFDPPGAQHDPTARSVRWDTDIAGRDELWVSHVVFPTAAGFQPVRTSGQLIFEDTQGGGDILKLAIPRVLAVDGDPYRAFTPFALREPYSDPQPFGVR